MKFYIMAAVMLVATSVAEASTFGFKSVQGELYSYEADSSMYCLALNVYHEARSEPLAGQYATADVVLNRVGDSRWPNSICDVVREGPISQWWLKEHGKVVPVRHRCQFSWYCDGKEDEPKDTLKWQDAQTVAYNILQYNMFRGITEGSTHYHATYVDPSWAKRYHRTVKIDTHIFYRAD